MNHFLEKALGHSPKTEPKSSASLLRVLLDEAAFARVVAHWRSLPAHQLPALRGLTVAPREGSGLQLSVLIEVAGSAQMVGLEITGSSAAAGAYFDFASLWPYAQWWQEEAETFDGVSFAGEAKGEKIVWRLA